MANDDHGAVVEATLDWSFVTPADLPELSDLRAAIEYFDDSIDHTDIFDLSASFYKYSAMPGWIATIGRVKGGGVAAYGSVHPDGTGRLWVRLAVHPTARHKQLGRKLVRWAVKRALECHEQHSPDSRLWLGYLLDERQAGLRHMLAEEGFRAERWFFDAHRVLLEEPSWPTITEPPRYEIKASPAEVEVLAVEADVSLPESAAFSIANNPSSFEASTLSAETGAALRIIPYTPERSDEVRLVLNQVWEHTPGTTPVTTIEWQEQMQLVNQFAGFSWLAVTTTSDEVVGYALNTILSGDGIAPDEGWTLRLGVAPSSRHNGVATALLQASSGSFWRAGLSQAGLGMDTDDPELALEFFRRCGYTPDDRLVQFRYHNAPSTR
ncbi:MAG: GNAT family N-acetyltransferase [Propionibacteriaceae bacterium]|jgi:GNAT superfamily N-acetyltransferase|nr:GNAT family N-acetyltransferase [Propionibacteriaceae bacterium]